MSIVKNIILPLKASYIVFNMGGKMIILLCKSIIKTWVYTIISLPFLAFILIYHYYLNQSKTRIINFSLMNM
jgi:hypothetical protein